MAFTRAIEIDDKLPDAFIGRGDAYIALAKYEMALADYEMAIKLGAGNIDEKIKTVKQMIDSKDLLVTLYKNLIAGNIDAAKELMRQEEYINMSAMLSDNHLYYDEGNNIGLAVYGKNYYYFGHWQNGQRNGNGLWIRAVYGDESPMESKIYDGRWENNKPNGEGMITEVHKGNAFSLF